MNIKLNDGVTREFQQGTAPLEMARELDGELYKNALGRPGGRKTVQPLQPCGKRLRG